MGPSALYVPLESYLDVTVQRGRLIVGVGYNRLLVYTEVGLVPDQSRNVQECLGRSAHDAFALRM
jgi:hypothetical protein